MNIKYIADIDEAETKVNKLINKRHNLPSVKYFGKTTKRKEQVEIGVKSHGIYAFHKGHLIGFITGDAEGIRKNIIYNLFVDAEYRSQGIGKKLLEEYIDHARDYDPYSDMFEIQVLSNNNIMKSFIKKSEFKEGGRRRNDNYIEGEVVDSIYYYRDFKTKLP